MAIECDVLVVGGGPAGLSAARAAARRGLKTIVIEEHKEIGVPVQCAEAVGEYLFPYLSFKIPKEQLIWKIKGMYFWADGIAVKREGGIWSGYAINRERWDKWLANLTIEEGAKILTGTALTSLEFDDSFYVNKAIAIRGDKKLEFKAKYIVGADGVNSKVIDCLGVRKKDVGMVGHVKSYEMKNIKLKYPEFEQLFLGEFAPGAYAYIFPLSQNSANIGVGTVYNKDKLDKYLEEFLEIPLVKNQLQRGKIISEKSGDAPIRDLTDRIVYGNVFLVGDAANQNIKPFIEGIIPGMVCGNILGNFLYDIVKKGDHPENYPEIIERMFGLIKGSQVYTDIVYGEIEQAETAKNVLMLGIMSGMISPNNEIDQLLKKDTNFLRNYIISKGGFIEEK